MRALAALLLLTLSGFSLADDRALPTSEVAFLSEIHGIEKPAILDLLGEPDSATDIRDRDTGEIVGTAWQYHYLNTSGDGAYYKTTELDFIGDQVVSVVFSNTDLEEDDARATPCQAKRSEIF